MMRGWVKSGVLLFVLVAACGSPPAPGASENADTNVVAVDSSAPDVGHADAGGELDSTIPDAQPEWDAFIPRDAAPVDSPTCESDHDGHSSIACGGDDCDDADASVYPGAAEHCNGVDDD